MRRSRRARRSSALPDDEASASGPDQLLERVREDFRGFALEEHGLVAADLLAEFEELVAERGRFFEVAIAIATSRGSLSPLSFFASVTSSPELMRSRMSRTSLRTVFGSMPCSRLCAIWRSRRRLVSPIARAIDSVIVSAYITTLPSTLRAARPIVWISDVPLRR